MSNYIASVVIKGATPAFDREFDYLCDESVQVGMRVYVPFGRGNTRKLAIVVARRGVQEGDTADGIKSVLHVSDSRSLLTEEAVLLSRDISERYFCSRFEAARLFLPPGTDGDTVVGYLAVTVKKLPDLNEDQLLLYKTLKRKRLPMTADKLCAEANCTEETLEELVSQGLAVKGSVVKRGQSDDRLTVVRLLKEDFKLPKSQNSRDILEYLSAQGEATMAELAYQFDSAKATVNTLKKQGFVELFVESASEAVTVSETKTDDIVLNEGQKRAYEELSKGIGEFSCTLLYGVTGSGKTEVFIRLIAEVLSRGKQVAVLVPEISLTPQTAAVLSSRFDGLVSVLHSGLSPTERREQWRRIADGESKIVMGTRSAIFAPFTALGLVVIDEEQSDSYISQSSPRFSAKEVATMRCRYHSAPLLLASATPSVESYHAASTGRFNLVELTERYSKSGLPQVITVDMREAPLAGDSTVVSEVLYEALKSTLGRKEQAILLLNRRGYNTLVKCSNCGSVVECPSCSVPMSLHRKNGRLVCHYCGRTDSEPSSCPSCTSELMRFTGVGTQRVEEELKALFPNAGILRLDTDTTLARHSHRRHMDSFLKHEYDILIGTQMVSKGLNFPDVTLVGVLSADQSLYTDDFRSYERTFSLITQVVGRSGRAERPGKAYIQTFIPENPIIKWAAGQDYPSFFGEELAFRRVGIYPPYCQLYAFVFSHEVESTVRSCAREFSAMLIDSIQSRYSDQPFHVLNISEMPLFKMAGRFRMRIIVKARAGSATKELFSELWRRYHNGKFEANLQISKL